jgi:hypothetical protein
VNFDFKIRKCNIAKDCAILRTDGESIIGFKFSHFWMEETMADGSNHPDIYSIDQWIDIMVGSEQFHELILRITGHKVPTYIIDRPATTLTSPWCRLGT